MQAGAPELEQRAERAVRRGELLVAIEHFEAHLAQNPDDERVRQRMESVRALLQPSELVSRRRAEPEETSTPAAESLSDAEQGEMHASQGRFGDAADAYHRAASRSPANELLRERLEELRALASPAGRADLHAAEKLEAATPARGSAPAGRSAKANDAVFGPLKSAPAPAPRKQPVALLQELLERVSRRRRRA